MSQQTRLTTSFAAIKISKAIRRLRRTIIRSSAPLPLRGGGIDLYWSAGKPILIGIVTYIGTYYDPILLRPLTNIGRSTSLQKVAFRGRAGKREKRSPTASLREGSRGADVWCVTLPQ